MVIYVGSKCSFIPFPQQIATRCGEMLPQMFSLYKQGMHSKKNRKEKTDFQVLNVFLVRADALAVP